MDHSHHYNLLIERAKTRMLEGYSERHHILPKCIGGLDNLENIVILTGREHYIAHQLLLRMYSKNSDERKRLIYAVKMMTIGTAKHGDRSKNRLYEWLRKEHAESISQAMMGNTNGRGNRGKPSPRRGIPRTEQWKRNHSIMMKGRKMGPKSEEHKEKIRQSMKGKNTGPKSKEHRRKLKGPKSEEHRCKLKGPKSEEHRRNLSKAMKNKPWSAARRAAQNKKKGQII